MPHELDRIKELAGLQQEAAVSLKGKESALKAWYNKYSKYTGGNGDPLPFGLIKAYTESGIISDGYEENELAKAEKALGKKEGDWEDQDWQKVYSMTPITQGMEQDLLKITGSKTIDEELLAKVYDVIEDMYPSYDQVLGKKESAVQEAPAAGLTAQQKQGLDAINAKYGKYIGYGNGGSLPVEAMERAIDPGSTLWADDKEENELKAYMKKMGYKDLSDMEAKDEEYMDNAKLPISDAMADDLQKVLGDYNDNPGLAQAAKDYLGSLGETAAQPVNSSVEDTIQRARAQIESLESQLKEDYKKFQGMKPYKPKKK